MLAGFTIPLVSKAMAMNVEALARSENVIALAVFLAFPILLSILLRDSLRPFASRMRDRFRPKTTAFEVMETEEEEEEKEVLDDGGRESTDCVVCLCAVVAGEKRKRLPNCRHWFHAQCIDGWLREHSTCPLCRSHVPGIGNGTSNRDQNHHSVFGSFDLEQEQQEYRFDLETLLSFMTNFVKDTCDWMANPLGGELGRAVCENSNYLC